MLNMPIILLFFFFLFSSQNYVSGDPAKITASSGDQILLSCPVNTQDCGAYHSLKWYHEDTRVYVFSPTAQFRNAEGALMSRCLDPTQTSLGPDCVRGTLEVTDETVDLNISPLEHADEGEYRCEITYLDISNNCPVVHFTEVITVAAPDTVAITDHEDDDISGQVVGPYTAGEGVFFSCQSKGKPAPVLTWKLGDNVLEGDISEDEEDGVISVKSGVTVELTMKHTGTTLSCMVKHEELEEDLIANVQIDVNVPVASVSIDSMPGQEGEEMTLTCTALGGRPAPTFSWVIPVEYQQEDSSSLQEDETYESVSKITFTPTYEENNEEVECHAINDVMDESLEDKIDLLIEYAPKVYIRYGNETVSAGDEVTIDCEIDANPTELLIIKWFHNGNELDDSDERFLLDNSAAVTQLTILPAQPSDSGDYSCSAENSVGESRSAQTFHLEVISPVKLVSIQEDLTGMYHEEMEIGCTAGGARPAAVIEWSLPSTEEFDFEVEEEVNLLDDETFETYSMIWFTPPAHFNGKEVSCKALNEAMDEFLEDKAELNIHYPPIVTVEENNMTIIAGEDQIISCEIDSNPENLTLVQWFHNGAELDLDDPRIEPDSQALSLAPAQVSFAGEYWCLAENSVGTGQSQILNVNVLSVVESVMIEDEEGTENVEMTMTCIASGGHLASTITWVMPDGVNFTVNEEVNVNEDETFETVSRLTFTPTADENEKNVVCEAINDVMDAPMEYATEMNILYKPIVTVEEDNITITAGDQVTLECNVDANPMNLSLVKWFHNEELVDTNNEKFEDGNIEIPSLTIIQVVAEDAGDYFCAAENQVGLSMPSLSVNLEVFYPPVVAIRKDPDDILREEDDMNVTLHCDLVDGNPLELSTVFWFRNGKMIRQLPDPHCAHVEEVHSDMLENELFINEASDYELGSGLDGSGFEDFGSAMEMGSGFNPDSKIEVEYLCDVDPTELFLQHVTRDFSGQFSCSGSNSAGGGPESEPVLLDILYIPGKAVITQEQKAQKGGSLTLLCNLEDQGNPTAEEYVWTRGDEILSERTNNLTLDGLSAESQGPVSCAGVNTLGQGEQDSLNITVFAPPTFLESLPEATTFVSHDTSIFLQCQVECFPSCSIEWMKNNEVITSDDDRFIIEESIIEEDVDANQFQSVISKLSWNLDSTANNKLDHDELNFTVSCFVKETDTDEEILSLTQVQVEYAPENIEISDTFLSIKEHEAIDPIFCFGEGLPEPSIVWKFDEKEIISENTLDFSDPLTRDQGGVYTCHISNDHGEEVVNVTIDVLFEPECIINHRLEDEEVVLQCSAEANPKDVKFLWEKNNLNFSGLDDDFTLQSEVRVKIMNESVGTYFCHVSNDVGQGEPCQIDLTMDMMTYWLTEEVTVILIAVAGSVIVLLIIIIITACLYCREKKENKGTVPKKKTKDQSPLLKDDQLHADSSFYENLPFKGLKSPPKQVLDDRNSDYMDYADADYLDIYANGPLKYREASEKNATLRRQKLEERKSVKSEIL